MDARMSSIEMVPELLTAQESHQDAVLAGRVLEQILELADEKTRLIAYLHYGDGFTLEETAAQVGMSVSGIRRRLRQLRSVAQRVEAR